MLQSLEGSDCLIELPACLEVFQGHFERLRGHPEHFGGETCPDMIENSLSQSLSFLEGVEGGVIAHHNAIEVAACWCAPGLWRPMGLMLCSIVSARVSCTPPPRWDRRIGAGSIAATYPLAQAAAAQRALKQRRPPGKIVLVVCLRHIDR
jgi:hypothetical protein